MGIADADSPSMPEQFSLAGFQSSLEPTESLFIAAIPDNAAALKIQETTPLLCKEHGLKGTPIAMERLHVTLHFIGVFADLPQGIVARTREAAASVKRTPFDVVFDRVKSFSGGKGKRPIVLRSSSGLEALVAFQRALSGAMARAALDRFKQPKFMPHLTLLYDSRRVAEQAIEPIGWTVNEFVLVRSRLGLSRHETLARWPLSG